LPAGSLIINRPPSIWQQYRWYVVTATALFVLQAGLIATLLVQRARRRRAELAVRSREAALQESHTQIRDLAGRLITAQEEERGRIARDLHDDFGQRLASLSIGLSNAKFDAPQTDGPLRERLTAIQEQTNELGRDLRLLSHQLHPGTLEHLGLVEAMRGRCDDVRAESGLDIRLDTLGDWSNVRADVALCLYRVTQETLHNVVAHAHAKNACISLVRQNGSLRMTVSDDGVGFDSGAAHDHGLGLLSMRERVQTAGGHLLVRSSPGAGTVVEVTLPSGDLP
jgi:two-component system sensor histidine kinase UhpB